MTALPLLLLALLPQDPGLRDPGQERAWHTRKLDNGVHVHIAEIQDAANLTVFTFLPTGLDGDPRARAQFAHLAEHMLIRSTDPKHLRVGDLALNGETTNQAMRLESLGPPKLWKESVRRHARWLTAREFDGKVLAREKIRIESEEKSTVPRGYNHKWATAAWAQIAAGSEHAAVHGDVANATVAQLEEYVRKNVRLPHARIFVAGPCKTADVLVVLREEFAKAEGQAKAKDQPARPAAEVESPAKAEPQAQPEPRHHEATWDLDASHYLEWYALGEGCTGAEAEILSQVVTSACFQQPVFRGIPGRGLAGVATRGGRRFLLLSANLPLEKKLAKDEKLDNDKKLAEVQAAFRKALDRAPALAGMMVRGAAMAARFDQRPDFAAQRKQVQNPRFRKLIEANWAMQCGYACVRLGVGVDELADTYRKVTAQRVRALAEGCTAATRHSARLTKKGPW